MSTDLFSLAHHIYRNAVVVIMKDTKYSVVPLVNLHWTLNALHYHFLQGTNNTIIPSSSVILLKMTLVNITVISVKKNETHNIGITIVQNAIILLIQNAFLENTQITNLEVFTLLTVTNTPLLSLRKLKTVLHVTNAMNLAKS
jgi:hypothetical protein